MKQSSIYRDSRRASVQKTGCNETLRQGELMLLGLFPILFHFNSSMLVLMSIGLFVLAVCGLSHFLLPGTLRPEEVEKGFPFGKLAYGLMVVVLMFLFHYKLFVAAAAWAVMAFGDGAATLVGIRFGKHPLPWNKGKSIEGTLAFLLAALLASTFMIWFVGIPLAQFTWRAILLMALVASFAGALVESMPPVVNDNISVPVIVGICVASVSHPMLMAYQSIQLN